jgi:Calpain family cysteine protease
MYLCDCVGVASILSKTNVLNRAIQRDAMNMLLTVLHICVDSVFVHLSIQEGKWQHIYIDTQIPCDTHSSNTTLFARSGQRNELWIMLLEKVIIELYII